MNRKRVTASTAFARFHRRAWARVVIFAVLAIILFVFARLQPELGRGGFVTGLVGDWTVRIAETNYEYGIDPASPPSIEVFRWEDLMYDGTPGMHMVSVVKQVVLLGSTDEWIAVVTVDGDRVLIDTSSDSVYEKPFSLPQGSDAALSLFDYTQKPQPSHRAGLTLLAIVCAFVSLIYTRSMRELEKQRQG